MQYIQYIYRERWFSRWKWKVFSTLTERAKVVYRAIRSCNWILQNKYPERAWQRSGQHFKRLDKGQIECQCKVHASSGFIDTLKIPRMVHRAQQILIITVRAGSERVANIVYILFGQENTNICNEYCIIK